MNIIKLKDRIHPTDTNFNNLLKGRYAYWIRMSHVVPLASISLSEYADMEKNIGILEDSGIYYIPSDEITEYIDTNLTEKANSVEELERYNLFVPAADVTMDMIRRFRTWLAESILQLDQSASGIQKMEFLSETFTRSMQYYAGGMYDDTLKVLQWITPYIPESYQRSTATCGCSVSLYKEGITINPACNLSEEYAKAMKTWMMDTFSDVKFWQSLPTSLLQEIYTYVENIIQMNLPLYEPEACTVYICGTENNIQADRMAILKYFLESMGYILHGETSGHLNFIHDTLRKWSESVYEHMEWPIS